MPNLKKNRASIAVVLLISLALFASGLTSAQADPYSELTLGQIVVDEMRESAARIAEVLISDYGVSSIQYALLADGEIVLSGQAGKFSAKESYPLTATSVYGIASTSKMYTAAAVMLLVDRGLIDLDESVTTYLPEFVMADQRYKQITVRMLLNHSSGLMGSTYANALTYGETNTYHHDNLLAVLSVQELKAEPGAFSVYCNDGFSLAEMVVERVSGLTFSEFLREEIANPLGLSYTFTPQDDWDRGLLARSFVRGEETPPEVANIIGTGGIYATAEELCRFGQIFMDHSADEVARNLLSPAAKEALRSQEYLRGMWPAQEDSIFGYGVGWDSVDLFPFNRYGIQVLCKGGDTPAYHSALIVIPTENMAFAATMSGGSSFFGQVLGTIVLQQVLLATGSIESILPTDNQVATPAPMPLEVTEFTGLYANNALVTEIRIEADGTLTMTPLTEPDTLGEAYLYQASGEFLSEDHSKRISFVTESNGQIYLRMIQTIAVPGLEQIAVMTTYEYVKIEPHLVDAELQAIWDKRSGEYYLVNEVSASCVYYHLGDSTVSLSTHESLPGYFGAYRIVDRDRAVQDVQIPVMAGRDLADVVFMQEDSYVHLLGVGSVAVNAKCIPEIPAGDSMFITGLNGYAQWYGVGEGNVGKTMTVHLPPQAAFAVYDSEECIHFSTVSGNRQVVLPAQGKVVFIGDVPGTRFNVTIK